MTKFTVEEVQRGEYILLIPPNNCPLIDGKTGHVMVFDFHDVSLARHRDYTGLTNDLCRIVDSLHRLEKR